MGLITRLNLRQNWPLAVALLIFVLTASLISVQFSSIKSLDAPRIGETISYWSRVTDPLLYNLNKNFLFVWPIVIFLSLLVFAVQRTQSYAKHQGIGCVFLLFANLFSCLIFPLSFLRPDGDRLVHVQSVAISDHIYHLSLDNVQGGDADYFYSIYFVFKCDANGNLCHAIHKTTNEYDFGGNPPPAILTMDSTSNSLYLQIGDKKIFIPS